MEQEAGECLKTHICVSRLERAKRGEKLWVGGTISYTRIRELVKRDMGYDSDQFGLHSFRAGGATAAANARVPDRLFKRHGRWRSETAKDGYIEDSEKEMLIWDYE